MKMRSKIFLAVVIVTGTVFFHACGKETVQEEKSKKKNVKQEMLKGDYEASTFEETDVESDTIQWMCSAYAIYSQYNDKSLDAVGGLEGEDREWYQDSVKIALADGWGILGRDAVERTVEKLIAHGHKEEYRKVVKEMEKKNLLEMSKEEAMANVPDDKNRPRYETVYEAYQKYGEVGIDGWDYCRALQILGDCYQAEYINLQECLDMSLPIAKKLQATYQDWEGLAKAIYMDTLFGKRSCQQIMTARRDGRFMMN